MYICKNILIVNLSDLSLRLYDVCKQMLLRVQKDMIIRLHLFFDTPIFFPFFEGK